MRTLGMANGPIERVAADVAVVPLFAGERPPRDAAGRVDWRLCGRLSHLLAAGRLDGAVGDAVLIPGGGGVRAPRVVGLGIGARDELDDARWEAWIADALARAAGLAAGHAVIALPESSAAIAPRLAALVAAAGADALPHEVTLAPEPGDAPAVGEWLRAAARRQRSRGVEVRVPSPGLPQGGHAAAPVPRSSHAPAGRSTR